MTSTIPSQSTSRPSPIGQTFLPAAQSIHHMKPHRRAVNFLFSCWRRGDAGVY